MAFAIFIRLLPNLLKIYASIISLYPQITLPANKGIGVLLFFI